MKPEPIRIALLLPDLLGTYGDRGNVIVLEQRLRWRGINCETVTVPSSWGTIPESCDLYVIGGGEDVAQQAAVRVLSRGSTLRSAVARGVPILGICGGFQILGSTFTTGDGTTHEGLGLLDVDTVPGSTRAIGEISSEPMVSGIETMTGFENHLGRTMIGAGSRPLGRVTRGTGNGKESWEGAVTGHTVGTYLHGPLLARNPRLADMLLEWALGEPLEPVTDIPEVAELRAERARPRLRQRK